MTDTRLAIWEREEARRDVPNARILALIRELRELRARYTNLVGANLEQEIEMVRFRARKAGLHCN